MPLIFNHLKRALAGGLALMLAADPVLAARRDADFWTQRARRASFPSPIAPVLPGEGAVPTISPGHPRFASPSLPPSLRALLNRLPAHLAVVRGARPAASPDGKTVVLVQDIHAHAEAQRNIGALIAALAAPRAIEMVGLEGAFGFLDYGPCRRFPARPAVELAADDMLARGDIAGPVHRALLAGPGAPPYWGVDDAALHARNAAAYRRAKQGDAAARAAWTRERAAWRAGEERVNPALSSFEKTLTAWDEGRRSLGEHAADLASRADPAANTRLYLDALDRERRLDFALAESERRRWMEDALARASGPQRRALADAAVAFRAGGSAIDFHAFLEAWGRRVGAPVAGRSAFRDYLAYVRAAGRVDPDALHADLVRMEQAIQTRLCRTAEENAWAARGRRLRLGRKLLDFALTPAEWETLRADRTPLWPGEDPGYRDFYAAAEARDRALADNLLARMAAGRFSTALLVAGGFHTAGIERALNARGLAVVTVSPRVTRVDPSAGSDYLTAFAREKTPLDRLFEGQRLFLAKEIHPGKDAFGLALRVATLDDDPARVFREMSPTTAPAIDRVVRDREGDAPRVTAWFRNGDGARAVHDAARKAFTVSYPRLREQGWVGRAAAFMRATRLRAREKLFVATALLLGAVYGAPGVGAAALLAYFLPERPLGPPAVLRYTGSLAPAAPPRFETPPETTRPHLPGDVSVGAEDFDSFKERLRAFYADFETEVVAKFAGKTVHDVDVPNAFFNQRETVLKYFSDRIKELPAWGEALNAEAAAGLPESIALRDRLITLLGYLQVFARDSEGVANSPTAGALFNVSRALFGRFHFPDRETPSLDQLIQGLTLRKPIVMVVTDVALDTDTMVSTAMEVRRRRMLNPGAVFVPVINGDFIPAEARHLLGDAVADDFLYLKDVRALGVTPRNASVLLMDHNENHTEYPIYGVVDHHVLCPLCAALHARGRSIGAIPQTPSTASLVTLAFWGMGVKVPKRALRALYGATLMDTENATESKMNDHVLNRTFLRFAGSLYFGPGTTRAGEDPANRLRRQRDDFYNEIMRVFLAEDNPKALFERDKKPFPGLVWANIQVLDKFLANGVPSPAFALTLDYFALRARAELAAGARAVVYNVIRYKTDPEDEESIIIRGNDLRLAFHPNEDPAFKAAMVEVARNFVADQPSTILKTVDVLEPAEGLVWIHSKSAEALARKKLQPMFDRVIRDHTGAGPGTLRWLWSARPWGGPVDMETVVTRRAPWESWAVALAVGVGVPVLNAAGLSSLWAAGWGVAWGLAHLFGTYDGALRPVAGRAALGRALALAAVGGLWTALASLGLDAFARAGADLSALAPVAVAALGGLIPREIHAAWNRRRYWAARMETTASLLAAGAAMGRAVSAPDDAALVRAALAERPVRSLGVGERFESAAEGRRALLEDMERDTRRAPAARALRDALARRGVNVNAPAALRVALTEWLAPAAHLFFVARASDLSDEQWDEFVRAVERKARTAEVAFVVPEDADGARVRAFLDRRGFGDRVLTEPSFRTRGAGSVVSLASLAGHRALAGWAGRAPVWRLYAPAEVALDAAGADPAWRDALRLRKTLLEALTALPVLRTDWDLIEAIARAVESAA
jgi:hypothetical protein